MPPLIIALIAFELVVMVLSISIHDCVQAWAANRLGDPTARMLGRITMNPLVHFDPFGMVLAPLLSIFLFHNALPYGWGKPVPMTYRNFPRKNGEVLAVAAGPLAQFLAAVVALIVLIVLKHVLHNGAVWLQLVPFMAHGFQFEGSAALPSSFPLLLFLYICIMVNLLLCIFNLLPMPFLDGGRILLHFLPYEAAKTFERYSLFFVIIFLFLGGFLVEIVHSPLLAIFTFLLDRF
ncbi:MAG TPA: site-2 protease family protein [Acidobacteriaceae bacterium]|jgi:Zn-dependent protease